MNPEVSTDKAHKQDGPLVIQDGELVFTGAQPWERFTRDLPRLRKIDDKLLGNYSSPIPSASTSSATGLAVEMKRWCLSSDSK